MRHAPSFAYAFLILCQQAVGQIAFTTFTNKPEYGYGETIELWGIATNRADTTVTLTGGYPSLVTGILFDNVRLHITMYPTVSSYVFPPHTSWNWIYRLRPLRLGVPNREGPHTLTCLFSASLGEDHFYPRDSVTVSAPAFHGGQLSVGFSPQTPTSEIQNLRAKMNATVISSRTNSLAVSEKWQTLGFILDSLVAKYTGDSLLLWIQADRIIECDAVIPMSVTHPVFNPAEYRLRQNYPNPFNPTCTIEFQIPRSQEARLSVYDLSGHIIRSFAVGAGHEWINRILFNGSDLASGTYFYRLQTPTFSQTRKMLLIR